MPDNAWPLVALYCLVRCVRDAPPQATADADRRIHRPRPAANYKLHGWSLRVGLPDQSNARPAKTREPHRRDRNRATGLYSGGARLAIPATLAKNGRGRCIAL